VHRIGHRLLGCTSCAYLSHELSHGDTWTHRGSSVRVVHTTG